MEYAIIGLVLAAALWFLARRARRALKNAKQPGCGCGCGSSCSAKCPPASLLDRIDGPDRRPDRTTEPTE